jgi:hypothetical protein
MLVGAKSVDWACATSPVAASKRSNFKEFMWKIKDDWVLSGFPCDSAQRAV